MSSTFESMSIELVRGMMVRWILPGTFVVERHLYEGMSG